MLKIAAVHMLHKSFPDVLRFALSQHPVSTDAANTIFAAVFPWFSDRVPESMSRAVIDSSNRRITTAADTPIRTERQELFLPGLPTL